MAEDALQSPVEGGTMAGFIPGQDGTQPPLEPAPEPRTGLVYPEHYEREGGGTLLPYLSHNVTTDEVRTTRSPLPGLVDDIWESMKALKAGVGYDQLGHVDFNPKDTLNVAGAAMTGSAGRLLTAEGKASLGVGGGRMPPPPKRIEVPLQTEKGQDFSIVRNESNPRDWTFKMDGKEVGEFSVLPDPAGNGMYNIDGIHTYTAPGTGLSRPAYAHFTKQFEELGAGRVVPSESLTEESYRNWLKMNPSLIEKGNYIKELTPEGYRWHRKDPTFSTEKKRADITQAPKQGILPFEFPANTAPHEKVRLNYAQKIRAGEDITLPPPKDVDPSIAPSFGDMNQKEIKKAYAQIKTKTSEVVSSLQKDFPDLQIVPDKSAKDSMTQYLYVKQGDQTIMKVRVADHGATSFDSLSIDPVSGNTLETVRQALRYELGQSDQVPEIGWSFLPPKQLRHRLNKDAGMKVFPNNRQIGGRAEYVKGGYRDSQTPYQVRTHDIGKDIQWEFPGLKDAAE